MTREETKRIIMIMVSVFSNYKPQDLTYTVDAWHNVLSDFEYKDISISLKAYILSDTSGFAPTPGQLIDKIHKIRTESSQLNEMEAWSLVSKALRNGTYGAEEEFKKLPPLVQKSVGSPSQLRNWATSDSESIENVIQSNFMRTYRVVCKREHEYSKLTPDILSLIEKPQEMIKLKTHDDKIEKIEDTRGRGVPMPKEVKEKFEQMKRSINNG